MKKNLHWSFDYRMHQEKNCDYEAAFFNSLKKGFYVQSNPIEYHILPNFRFNHKAPKIQNQTEMHLGTLKIYRKQLNNEVLHQIHRYDDTSGENLEITYRNALNPLPKVIGEIQVNRFITNAISETIKKTEQIYLSTNTFGLQSIVGYVSKEEPLISIFDLFVTIPSYLTEIPFSMFDETGLIFSSQHLVSVGTDTLEINGTLKTLHGYCLYGKGTGPIYFWLNEYGNTVIVTNRILTYVRTAHQKGDYDS